MEFDLIPQIVIIFSAGVIVFIFGKNVPKVKEDQDNNPLFKNRNKETENKFLYLRNRLTRRINRDGYQNKMNLVWKWLEKSLRKIRIKFLKLDNKIVSVLEKLKKKHTEREDSKSDNEKLDSDRSNAVGDIKSEENRKAGLENDNRDNVSKENNFANEVIDKEIDKETEKKTENSRDEGGTEIKKEKNGKEKEYLNLIFKNPMDIKAYWKLGVVYSRKKKYKDSISCFRQIIKIDPGYTKAKKKIVDLMGRMKNGKKDSK